MILIDSRKNIFLIDMVYFFNKECMATVNTHRGGQCLAILLRHAESTNCATCSDLDHLMKYHTAVARCRKIIPNNSPSCHFLHSGILYIWMIFMLLLLNCLYIK